MENKVINHDTLVEVIKGIGVDGQRDFCLSACGIGDLSMLQTCLDAEICNVSEILCYFVESENVTLKVVKWLVGKGADVNYKINDFSVLNRACMYAPLSIVRFLIKNGAKFEDIRKNRGSGDLYWMISKKRCKKVPLRKVDYEKIEFLLKSGAPCDKDPKSPFNTIDLAIDMNDDKLVELLFNYCDVSPNLCINGAYLLHKAVEQKNVKIARFLLEKKADVNAKLEDLDMIKKYHGAITPRDIAVFNKDASMEDLLAIFGGTVTDNDEKIRKLLNCRGEVGHIIKDLMNQKIKTT